MSIPRILPFAEFADSVKPSGAVNRFPQIGSGMDVLTYSVYMNGPAAKDIPVDSQESHYQDVMLHPLTEKLGLNPEVFRDNMKVAELVAIRYAWMAAVLDSSLQRNEHGELVTNTPEIVRDYELLTDGLTHPWIQEQINAQKSLSQNLRPALDAAEVIVGTPVIERVPYEVSNGTILSQNNDFTVQEIGNGDVVAHENRRLIVVPAIGQNVTVTYYRGNGQVFENSRDLHVSVPYIDGETGDLAVQLVDNQKTVQHVVLFNGVASFAKFVDEQGLDKALIKQAVDVRAAEPKKVALVNKAIRSYLSDAYIDPTSSCIAFDYTENNGRHTVLFGSVDAMAQYAPEFGIDAKRIEQSRALESGQKETERWLMQDVSRAEAIGIGEANFNVTQANTEKGRYVGQIYANTDFHVVQDIGRKAAVIHDKRNLDKVPAVGQQLSVTYTNGRGAVVETASKDRGR